MTTMLWEIWINSGIFYFSSCHRTLTRKKFFFKTQSNWIIKKIYRLNRWWWWCSRTSASLAYINENIIVLVLFRKKVIMIKKKVEVKDGDCRWESLILCLVQDLLTDEKSRKKKNRSWQNLIGIWKINVEKKITTVTTMFLLLTTPDKQNGHIKKKRND